MLIFFVLKSRQGCVNKYVEVFFFFNICIYRFFFSRSHWNVRIAFPQRGLSNTLVWSFHPLGIKATLCFLAWTFLHLRLHLRRRLLLLLLLLSQCSQSKCWLITHSSISDSLGRFVSVTFCGICCAARVVCFSPHISCL